jgi:hypothetical protein
MLSKLNDEVKQGIINVDKIKSFHATLKEYKNRNLTTLMYYMLRENWNDFPVWIIEFLELFQAFYENKMSIIKNEYEVLGDAPYNNFKRDYDTVANFVKQLVVLHKTKANFIENHTLLDYCCERSLTTSNNFPFQQFLSILTSNNTDKLKIKMLHNLFYKVKKNKLNSLILYRIGDLLTFTEIVTKFSDSSLTLIKYAKSYHTSNSNRNYKYNDSSVLLINDIATLFNTDNAWNKNNITISELKHLLTVEEYFDAILFVGIFDFIINYKYQFNDYTAALSTFLDKYTKFIQAINSGAVLPKEDTYITLKSDKYSRDFIIEFNKFLTNGYAKN